MQHGSMGIMASGAVDHDPVDHAVDCPVGHASSANIHPSTIGRVPTPMYFRLQETPIRRRFTDLDADVLLSIARMTGHPLRAIAVLAACCTRLRRLATTDLWPLYCHIRAQDLVRDINAQHEEAKRWRNAGGVGGESTRPTRLSKRKLVGLPAAALSPKLLSYSPGILEVPFSLLNPRIKELLEKVGEWWSNGYFDDGDASRCSEIFMHDHQSRSAWRMCRRAASRVAWVPVIAVLVPIVVGYFACVFVKRTARTARRVAVRGGRRLARRVGETTVGRVGSRVVSRIGERVGRRREGEMRGGEGIDVEAILRGPGYADWDGNVLGNGNAADDFVEHYGRMWDEIDGGEVGDGDGDSNHAVVGVPEEEADDASAQYADGAADADGADGADGAGLENNGDAAERGGQEWWEVGGGRAAVDEGTTAEEREAFLVAMASRVGNIKSLGLTGHVDETHLFSPYLISDLFPPSLLSVSSAAASRSSFLRCTSARRRETHQQQDTQEQEEQQEQEKENQEKEREEEVEEEEEEGMGSCEGEGEKGEGEGEAGASFAVMEPSLNMPSLNMWDISVCRGFIHAFHRTELYRQLAARSAAVDKHGKCPFCCCKVVPLSSKSVIATASLPCPSTVNQIRLIPGSDRNPEVKEVQAKSEAPQQRGLGQTNLQQQMEMEHPGGGAQLSHEVEVDDDIQADGFWGNNSTEPESDVEEVEA
ncbi:unnamed protein product [Closterium sp. NIES-53]